MKLCRFVICFIFVFAVIGDASILFAQFGGMAGGRDRATLRDKAAPKYVYPSALDIPKGNRPQIQTEEQVAALKRFSLELYKQLIAGEDKLNKNVVCSPWSIAMVLTMLHDGANADTAAEIQEALQFQDNSKSFEKYLFMAAFNARGKEKRADYPAAPLILETANSFWAQTGYEFHDSYLELLKNRFMAGLFTADFKRNPAKAAKEINQWCDKQTQGEIKEIISENGIPSQLRMLILNAVYFKARWADVFYPESTKSESFHHADGSESKTLMMNATTFSSGYYETAGFKVLRKNYCGNVHMLILLPDKTDGLAELEKTITPEKLRQIDSQLKNRIVNVKIPRFSFENSEELISPLQKMGIEAVFDMKKADFSKMTAEKGFFIDLFQQTAMIRVDEEGTVAVAAAITGGGSMGGGPSKIYKFYADRPFLFLIRENTDNSILFIGRVHQPEKVERE